MGQRVLVAVTDRGHRTGETHHNSTIPDSKVELIRDCHECYGWGYVRISLEFGIALTTVRKICTYERRAATATRWKSASAIKNRPAQNASAEEILSIRRYSAQVNP
jgi:hypothetical protein